MIYTQIRPLDQPGVALARLSGPPMGAGKGLGATDATPAPLEVKGARWKAGYFSRASMGINDQPGASDAAGGGALAIPGEAPSTAASGSSTLTERVLCSLVFSSCPRRQLINILGN